MSRTLRRGKPSRNRQLYLKMGVIWSQNEVSPYSETPYWVDDWRNPGTYEDHVRREVRKHHRDKGGRGTPSYIRQLDVKLQSREHRNLIHVALRSGDTDVALTVMSKRHSWNYW